MINLHYSNGKAFVWSVEDVCTLREKHRIVGSLIGCYPFKSFQVDSKWLPLELLPEEVTLLIEKGYGQLISLPEKVTDSEQINSYYEKRNKLFDEQSVLFKENRKKEIVEKANLIYEGKKRKFLEKQEKEKKAKIAADESHLEINQTPEDKTKEGISTEDIELISNENSMNQSEELCPPESEEFNLDKNAIIEEELSKVSDVSKDLCMVQLFAGSPWKSNPTIITNWTYPSTEQEKLRYAVFKDLWEKSYYITPGSKFGGDFLAYEGDPLKFHAMFIVVCKFPGDKFQGSDLVVYGRLAHQVKKTIALASLNTDGGVDYISVNWENKMV